MDSNTTLDIRTSVKIIHMSLAVAEDRGNVSFAGSDQVAREWGLEPVLTKVDGYVVNLYHVHDHKKWMLAKIKHGL